MDTVPQKICKYCGVSKDADIKYFPPTTTRGKRYLKAKCRDCVSRERENGKRKGKIRLCEDCDNKTREHYNRSLRSRLERKKCGSCGDVHDNGQHNCETCKAKYKRKREQILANGLCITCKKPRGSDGTTHSCLSCNQKRSRESAELRGQILVAYGGRCKCCGESEPLFLNIDHVNNDGAQERRAGKSRGISFYRRVVQSGFPNTYQLLCFNCNCTRGFFGECPHVSNKAR